MSFSATTSAPCLTAETGADGSVYEEDRKAGRTGSSLVFSRRFVAEDNANAEISPLPSKPPLSNEISSSLLQSIADATLDVHHFCGNEALRLTGKRTKITSLPDELLALIFRMATLTNGTRQAVSVSHVSRRFREIALEERSLWATLHSSASKEELEEFISRCGVNTDLHIVIHISQRYFDLHAFMHVCLPTASRWRTLTVSEAGASCPSAHFILKTMDRSYNLHLPRLHELHIKQDRRREGDYVDGAIRFRPSWISPNLRVLKCEDYLPLHSISFLSLSSFDSTIHLSDIGYHSQVERLLSFLASVPSITDVTLRIHSIASIEFVEAIEFEETTCPSITSLSLHFSGLPNGDGSDHFVAVFMRALCAPNAERLSLAVEFRYADLMDSGLDGVRGTEMLKRLSHALLPIQYAGSHLKSLSYHLECSPPSPRYGKKPIRTTFRTFTIPFEQVSHIASLTLKMSNHVRVAFAEGRNVDQLQDSTYNLEEIRFLATSVEDVLATILSLEDVVRANLLERVVLSGSNALYAKLIEAGWRGKFRHL